ncbi:MAG: GNAT family N-acetyltransferase [Gemmatimonadota bacterium]
MTEAWLRGPVEGVPDALMPAAHALVDAGEELERAARDLDPARLWARPGGVASVGFHLRHVVGSLDRLLTYARGEALNAGQLRSLAVEAEAGSPPVPVETLLDEVRRALEGALEVLRVTPPESLDEERKVGRAGLPSTVRGLLFHAAEHTRRHAGQVIATAGILRGSGAWPDPRLVGAEGTLERRVGGYLLRRAEPGDGPALIRMRQSLWPDSEASEVEALLEGTDPPTVTFVAENPAGEPQAFAEVGLRRYAEGCVSSPVAYLEGIWVDAEARRAGIGTALVRLAEAWGVAIGLQELASDVEPNNAASLAFHRAAGFEDTGTVSCFRVRLGPTERPR